jgi:hypothetical protein
MQRNIITTLKLCLWNINVLLSINKSYTIVVTTVNTNLKKIIPRIKNNKIKYEH